MFEEGTLLYITPFYFINGANPENKFFICLKKDHSDSIILSLPTSQDKIPSYHDLVHGCNDIEKAQQCSYCFLEKKIITHDTNFSFEKDTFLFGSDIQKIDSSLLTSKYKTEGVDYVIKGKLTNDEFNSIIECFKSSKSVARKIKNML